MLPTLRFKRHEPSAVSPMCICVPACPFVRDVSFDTQQVLIDAAEIAHTLGLDEGAEPNLDGVDFQELLLSPAFDRLDQVCASLLFE